MHCYDMVIADAPMPSHLNVRVSAPALLEQLPGRFPSMLDQAPFLLPGEDVAIFRLQAAAMV